MVIESVGTRFKKALETKYGIKNNPLIAKKYNYTPQTIGQAKSKKSINETISLICEMEKINLNWIQTGKGEMFLKEEQNLASNSSINVNNSKNVAVNGSKNTIIDNSNIVYKDKIKNDLNIDDDILEISKLLQEYGSAKMKQDLKTKLLQIKALHDE